MRTRWGLGGESDPRPVMACMGASNSSLESPNTRPKMTLSISTSGSWVRNDLLSERTSPSACISRWRRVKWRTSLPRKR